MITPSMTPCYGQDNGTIQTAKMMSYVYSLASDRHMSVSPETYAFVDSTYTVSVIDSVDGSAIMEVTSFGDPFGSRNKRLILDSKITLLYGFGQRGSDIKIRSNINVRVDVSHGPKIASALMDFEYDPGSYICREEGQSIICTSDQQCTQFRPIGDGDTWSTRECEP
jgi:hypothetical protein